MWLPPTAIYSPVRVETYPKREFSAFYSHFLVTSGEMMSLQGHFRSCDLISGDVTASTCELQLCRISNVPKTWVLGLLQPPPGDFRWNDVTYGHVKSCDIISLHVTDTCELQPCRSSNVSETRVLSLLQPLPGDFQSNNVTSVSISVTWGHMTSFPEEWQPPASYSSVRISNVPQKWVVGLLQQLPGDFRWNDVTSWSLPVTWGQVTSFSLSWLSTPVSVAAQTYPEPKFLAFCSYFLVTSGKMTSLQGHFRSREVPWPHFLSRDCHVLRVKAL